MYTKKFTNFLIVINHIYAAKNCKIVINSFYISIQKNYKKSLIVINCFYLCIQKIIKSF